MSAATGGGYVLDVGASTLTYGGETRRLLFGQVRLLEAIAGHRGAPVHIDSICARLWPGGGGLDPVKTCNVHLCRLRRYLCTLGWPDPVETIYGGIRRLRIPVEVRGVQEAIVIPGAMRDALLRLLHAHPDHGLADRFLELIQ